MKNSKRIASRIIRAVAGVTSRSNSRAGFAIAHTAPYRKFGFTLAEVLITLGIIGVVAALTIPSLVVKHRKQVVVEKLKKASSALMQANNMAIMDHGTFRETFPALNGDTALEMFNKYYVPYMKFLKVEKGEKGVYGYLPDGTILYFYRAYTYPNKGWSDTYIVVCMEEKACIELDSKVSAYTSGVADGKNTFGLYTNGIIPTNTFKTGSHEYRIESCKNNSSIEACSALIFEAGWKIPEDYPIKF